MSEKSIPLESTSQNQIISQATLDISVIICAYTMVRWDDLVAAVASVQTQLQAARELIVVIDYNPELLEKAQDSFRNDVNVIANTQTRGLAGARNSGLAIAKGAVLAFLDDDAVAAPDWLRELSQGYKDAQVLGVGGYIEPLWATSRPAWFPEEFYWVIGCTYRGLPRTTAPVRNLIGANMSFRREVLERTKGFQTGVGQVGESMLRCDDTEFCIRANQQWPERIFLYEPQAKVQHRVPAGRAQWRYFQTRCYTEGLAKAIISQLVGTKAGLASEQLYTFRTIPQGVAQGVADAVFGFDRMGLARAGVIIAGLALTSAGYLVGSISRQLNSRKHWLQSFKTKKVKEIENQKFSGF